MTFRVKECGASGSVHISRDVSEHLRLARLLRLVLQGQYGLGEGCGEEEGLAFFRELVDDVREFGGEGLGEETVGFVEDLCQGGTGTVSNRH